MSACLALRKDYCPCRQYAREGEFTCRQHANFFADPSAWLEKTIYTYHDGHLQTIENHMKRALEAGAIRIRADMLIRTSDVLSFRNGRPPVRLPRPPHINGSTYLILMRFCPELCSRNNESLFFRASIHAAKSLISWHRCFAPMDDTPIPNTKGILADAWKSTFAPVLRNDTQFLRILDQFLLHFMTGQQGHPVPQSRHIWRSFLENYLAEFGDHPTIQKRIWSETKSFDPMFASYTRAQFWHTYARVHMEVWAEHRQKERTKILKAAKERCAVYKEDLIAFGWHPDRFLDWCLDVEELADLRAGWVQSC
jgi:hypothetical protein